MASVLNTIGAGIVSPLAWGLAFAMLGVGGLCVPLGTLWLRRLPESVQMAPTMSDVHAVYVRRSWQREASSIPAGPYATDTSLKRTTDVGFDDLYPSSIMGAYARQPSVGKEAERRIRFLR